MQKQIYNLNVFVDFHHLFRLIFANTWLCILFKNSILSSIFKTSRCACKIRLNENGEGISVKIAFNSIFPSSIFFKISIVWSTSIKSSKTSLLASFNIEKSSEILFKALIKIIEETCCLPTLFFLPLYCLRIINDLVAQCLNLLLKISVFSIACSRIFLNFFYFYSFKSLKAFICFLDEI